MSRSLLIAAIALTFAGCGSPTGDLHGTVTLNGQPVADGVISFQPEKETRAPSVGGRIVDGEYDVQGLVPGMYRVEVRSWATTSKTVNGPFGPTQERINIIPKRYWGETTQLHLEVRPGANAGDFELSR
jgi:hypothetical protein